MDIVLHVVHVLAALALIGLVLIQHGKGADAGASFGGGGSQTVFGSAGSANFLTRSTAVLAAVFFVTSLALAWMARNEVAQSSSILPMVETVDEVDVPESDAPAVPQSSDVPSNSQSDVPAAGADVPASGQGDAPAMESSEKGTSDVPASDVESPALDESQAGSQSE
ncbi:Preprotein translocase SecG subunit, putative [Alloalcanivorax dieselolei B5]|uniref:Protein-export membrane protein SecG n=1 Tax=Alcanivorax dieselolei (strain DSM 16502 / CGMCC 1.3690 / MCCC 1A00001 / B-5) TaxID=930169 RepID=K0CHN6_ALCDB|nr:preprotein translocase subunit SecG [Alloalcanivorax dieselolei]AFT72123.1 Preprotein translocase SecG subunit, putative [Alloalcanivorax dieselolei B5]GGJ75384.1 hypothetical protein GCM10007426_00450 [Alloalcanivorax dieselolei]